MVLVIKMATLLEERSTEQQSSVVRFFFVGEMVQYKEYS
jgi:hypothetical protein